MSRPAALWLRMVPASWRRLVPLLVVVQTGCGSRAPVGGDGVKAEAVSPADAGVADAAPLAGDFGADAAEVASADASLAEMGVAPCDAVAARFLTCPGVPEASKQQMAAASRRWHQEAEKSPDRLGELAAACLEIARLTEEMLLDLGC